MSVFTRDKVKSQPSSTQIPDLVVDYYKNIGGNPDDLDVILASDLSEEGKFGSQWLLIDHENLRVIQPRENGMHEQICIGLNTIQTSQIEQCVGNALLQVTTDGKSIVLMHFSNELTERFALVSNYLRQRVEKKEETLVPNLTSDGNRCISCGKRLLDPSLKVCPSCIKQACRLHWRKFFNAIKKSKSLCMVSILTMRIC